MQITPLEASEQYLDGLITWNELVEEYVPHVTITHDELKHDINDTPQQFLAYITNPHRFICSDCKNSYRLGMNVEVNSLISPYLCVYCHNKASRHTINPQDCIERADRLEHEESIKEFAELYVENLEHFYYTNAEYQLTIKFPASVNLVDILEIHLKLKADGMRVGNIEKYNHSFFTIDFKDHERVFLN